MKKEYKVILSYFLACACFIAFVDPTRDAHPHVALSQSLLFYIAISPLYAPMELASLVDALFSSSNAADFVQRVFSLVIGLAVFFGCLFLFIDLSVKRLPRIRAFISEKRATKAAED
jgi:hypothetical protein